MTNYYLVKEQYANRDDAPEITRVELTEEELKDIANSLFPETEQDNLTIKKLRKVIDNEKDALKKVCEYSEENFDKEENSEMFGKLMEDMSND